MITLGIETSCDETAVALLDNREIISQRIASQENLHSLFGGVVPELASREHMRILPVLIDAVFDRAGMEMSDVDNVAVARGPGLLGSLLVGLGMAKGCVLSTGANLVGVNHLMAHLLVTEMQERINFPALGVLISGGHTQLYKMRSRFDVQLIGRTLDDAMGEAFDKTAKLLNLPYPGGKYIDKLAGWAEPDKDLLPSPYLDNRNLDFSFSGIKTAISNFLKKKDLSLSKMDPEPDIEEIASQNPDVAKLCASFNWSMAKTLYTKVKRALDKEDDIKTIVMAGGVASNHFLREKMRQLAGEYSISLLVPSPSLCTDNAAMIAYSGFLLAKQGYVHDLGLEGIPRGKAIPWDYNNTT